MFQRIATHTKAHWEEMVACWELIRFGEHQFPGTSTAKIEFWENFPADKTAADFEKEGILLVGIGGGRFDEHASATADRKKDHCAATLVAQAIGLDEDPALKALLDFTTQRDLTLSGSTFDLSGMIKLMYNAGRDDMTVWTWAFDALQAIYDDSMKFFEGAGTDFAKARTYKVETGFRPLTFAVGTSDSPQFAKFARSPHGARAGVVIQRKSSGNVMIQTRNSLKIDLRDVAKIIRIEELKAAGKPIPRDWKLFVSEGKVPGCDEWYFFPEGRMLLNDSTTHKNPPTQLALEDIEQLVQIGVSPKRFQSQRTKQCQSGKCTSTRRDPCSWFDWGLQRCEQVRQQEKQKRVPQASQMNQAAVSSSK